MRVFHREFGHEYETYEFGYTTYASLEPGETVARAYDAGFLPHSADPSVRDIFYMARSVRVPLASFLLSSENRRILKKFAGQSSCTVLSKKELLADTDLLSCFLNYFKERHGERVMNEERARGIFSTPHPIRAVRYEHEGSLAGYVLEIADSSCVHYWYSCYAPAYTGSSFGMWLMLDAILRGQKEGRENIYLGTAYGAKGKYKTNFAPLEFWDGSSWNKDTQELKRLIGA